MTGPCCHCMDEEYWEGSEDVDPSFWEFITHCRGKARLSLFSSCRFSDGYVTLC